MVSSPFMSNNSSLGRSPPPERLSPAGPESPGEREPSRRRGSFSFLRRTKSGTQLAAARSPPSSKLSKKQRGASKEHDMSREPIPSAPPRIPDIPRPTQLQTFGGESAKPVPAGFGSSRLGSGFEGNQASNSYTNNMGFNMYSNVPIPPIPGFALDRRGEYADQNGRTDSMTHRGRYSYASSAISTINSPRRVRRRKDPTPFNILVIGECNSGKSSFINFLRTSLALPARKQRPKLPDDIFDSVDRVASAGTFSDFSSHYVETEIEGERIGLTLWDSQGLEPNLVDLQLREMASFLESKFEETFNEEMKVARAPGMRDTHIHCAFLILDPVRLDSNIAAVKNHASAYGGTANGNSAGAGPRSTLAGGLDDNFELEVLRTLRGKTTVVPIIAKADTITSAHMAYLKRAVWRSLKSSKLDHLEAIGLEDGDLERSVDRFGLHERDENRAQAVPSRPGPGPDASHLDSPTDSNSSRSASEFNLAKPSRPMATTSSPALSAMASSPAEPPPLPFSIISPDMYEPDIPGRKFPWGFADPFHPEHCDFSRLQETVFTDWREELKEASRDLWYERWRTSRLNGPGRGDGQVGWAQ